MSQTVTRPTPGSVVRLPADKNLDKQIDYCRFGARNHGVTVVIEKQSPTKAGHVRRTPIMEVTPAGDIREITVPTMRTPMAAFLSGDVAALATKASAIVERRKVKNRKRRDRKQQQRSAPPVQKAAA